MNIPQKAEAVPLSHERLRAILEAHARHVATQGQEGQRADLTLRIVKDFSFTGLDLWDGKDPLYGTVFLRCRFVGTELYTLFMDVSAPGADFQKANLAKSEFWDCNLSGANFDGAGLLRVNFFDCDLRGATFRGANLSTVSFRGSDTEGAIFDSGFVPGTA